MKFLKKWVRRIVTEIVWVMVAILLCAILAVGRLYVKVFNWLFDVNTKPELARGKKDEYPRN